MTNLSEKLADICVQVGDIEARTEAFCFEQPQIRDQMVEGMRTRMIARQGKLQSAVQAGSDEISSIWGAFIQSMQSRAEQVRAQIEAEQSVMELENAKRHAERLQLNAILAVDFAVLAMEDAELAVAEAFQARIQAGEISDTEKTRAPGREDSEITTEIA
ncbi:MAG: hypothetical protein ACR2O1_05595 [Boseongicola sp.]